MEINETQLRKLVERIMELTLELTESNNVKKEILVVLAGKNQEQLKTALEALPDSSDESRTIVVTKGLIENEELGQLICKSCETIIQPEEVLSKPLSYEKIIFPAMPRDILAKCALCIPDTYEVALVQKAFEESVPIVLSKNALSPFTGKEPESYQNCILGYIKRLLEYGIEIEL